MEAISADWDTAFSITPEKLVFGWRQERRIYDITLPATGWLVDIGHADTIQTLNREFAIELAGLGVSRLTRADICGEQRGLTVRLAKWIHDQELFDGERAHGVQFRSKHGDRGVLWAVWLRRMADGLAVESEPTFARPCDRDPKPQYDKDLKWAADALKVNLLG